ncbi:MAG TPA: hypothetical protein VMW48_17390 [Vicinamibacterales bacterium]|nr:hypothetical protein [Vicinamibacterales bacterium]
MIPILTGLAAGFLHVLAGPDHLAAVAPIAVSDERAAWRSGLVWGVGHTAGVMLVGALLLAFRELLPLDALSAWSERAVGAALVAIGVWGLWSVRHPHAHSHVSGHASLAMGTMHGLAGSSHLFGVLPALLFASRLDAATYLSAFGAGAIAAMTAFAAVIGSVATASGRSDASVRRTILYATSVTAVAVGGVWLLA